MATEVGAAYVSIVPSAKGFGASLNRGIGRQVDSAGTASGKRFGGRFSTGVGGAIAGVGRGIAAIAGPLAVLGGIRVLGGFVEDARESARISALTAQAIKSTGGAANVSAKQVSNLATRISQKTGIDDEAVQSGANLLLTFTNIRNELGRGNKIFDRANQTVTDMSAALGQDTKSSAIQLGKALNDPVKGITALSRVGVAFTDQQKEQIKTMVESGNRVGAQKVILAELGKEFGGAAAAMATPGDRLKVTLGNLGESIGAQLIPQIDRFANFMVTKGVPALIQFGGFIKTQVVPVLKQVGAFITANVIPALVRFGGFIQSTILPALRNFGMFVATTVVPGLARMGNFVRSNIAFFAPFAGTLLAAVAVIKTIAVVTKLWAAAQLVLNLALTANPIGLVVVAIAALVGGLVYAYRHSERFRAIVNAAFATVKAAILPVVNIIRVVVPRAFGVLVSLVRGYISTYISIVRGVFRVVQFFVQLPVRVLNAIGDFGKVLYQSGRDLIRGLINGIKSMALAPVNAVKGVAGKIGGAFKGALGIGSPSKVFAGFGVNINEGLLLGLKKSEGLLHTGAKRQANTLTGAFRAPATSARRVDVRRPGVGVPGGDIIIHNPKPEPASESVEKAIQRKKHRQGWAAA